METYEQMHARHMDEINAFPIGWAFSREQLEMEKKRLGVSSDSELCAIQVNGGFVRKADAERYVDMTIRQIEEQAAAMKDYDFALGAFVAELANHEYGYTRDPRSTIEALGFEVRWREVKERWHGETYTRREIDELATFDGCDATARAFREACRRAG